MQPQLDEGAHKLSPGLQHRPTGLVPVCVACKRTAINGRRPHLLDRVGQHDRRMGARAKLSHTKMLKCADHPRSNLCSIPPTPLSSVGERTFIQCHKRTLGRCGQVPAGVAKSWADVSKSRADVA